MRLIRTMIGALLVVCSLAFHARGQTNGIFADFSTSMGAFTVALDYVRAPRAAANFIGLATGERKWLDPELGIATTNGFLAGTRFHSFVKTVEGAATNTLAIRGGLRPVRDAGGADSFYLARRRGDRRARW